MIRDDVDFADIANVAGESRAAWARTSSPARMSSYQEEHFLDGMGPGGDCAETAEQFDYDAYLEFLKEHGHNFIRLWCWEQFNSQAAGGAFHLCMTPQP